MSQVAISGNASGTGTLTIAAPNTNSNYTLTLPALTGTILTNKTAGTVLQVVQGTSTSGFNTTSASFTSTSISASITPSSSSNKVFVLVSTNITNTAMTGDVTATIYRSATDLSSGSGFNYYQNAGSGSVYQWVPTIMSYLDSPATTSSTTYTIYIKRGVAGTAYIGSGIVTTITLMEIAA